MNNKKMLMSLLLIVLLAVSVSAVSAAEDASVLAADDSQDVVGADSNAQVLKANIWKPNAATAAGIQEAIDSAQPGDTVDLSSFKEYNVTDSTITISGKDNLFIKGKSVQRVTINGYGSGDGIFYVSESSNVRFACIDFVDVNPENNLTYDGVVKGWGINFDGEDSNGGQVTQCTFKDFNQAVVINSCNNVEIRRSTFTGGIATKLINDPTVNKEQGSKVISVGGSFFTSILNNVFDGPVLDAISIAKGSGDAQIIGNKFYNNAYSIFFGGASTEGTFIKNNEFFNCGYFQDENRYYDEFPVISIQKAADSVYFEGNKFHVINNNILIAAESSNTAHGAPSTLGDINVTNNIIELSNPDVVARSVTLLHILSRQGDINPKAPITVTGNTFPAGIRPVVVWYNDWGSEDGDVVIPQAQTVISGVSTTIAAENAQFGVGTTNKYKLTLKDKEGNAVADRQVSAIIDGVVYNATTDDKGIATLSLNLKTTGVKTVNVIFLGDANYTGSMSSAQINVTKKITSITAGNVTIPASEPTKVISVTLKYGKLAVSNKKLTLTVDGKTYTAKTNSKGVAEFAVDLDKVGSYKYTVKFAGDANFEGCEVTNYVKIA
ncbi:hypothetical protein TL18_03595 [Methanobrevibacter sp. YE315]|uniref:Ig-like domain-containing protein n=1 Tax=Methanobrevibacter sp. YE315 TaxID=1609968 RepID=UPI000764EA65|nr:Ig-like domain-containing protein [Methanobrevibacter sp. YE315]AMD17184.1 hypothetical protein TL18_03595 [Methanobrevibacter sp. YE315]